MAEHQTFRFRTLDELEARVAALGLDLPFAREISALAEPWRRGRWSAPNRLAVQPMEGCDGLPDGAPGPLTVRRYKRFGAGGAGLLWFEACAVAPEGRANPRQLWLHGGAVEAYAALLRTARAAGRAVDAGHRALCILQLTHSGRYSRPYEGPLPQTAHRGGPLDAAARLAPDAAALSDDALEALEDRYVEAAVLAYRAGFDGVDVKACHGYLVNELLAAFTREGSRYGGSYENRTRFLRNVVGKIRAAVPDLLVCARLNVFDAIPYPYGWGVAREGDGRVPDLSEPIRLVRELHALGVPLVNVTAGNPYYNPHIGRPFDLPIEAAYTPDEHPLEGVARLMHLTRRVQQAVPEVACVGTGYSWLRQFLGHAGEAAVRAGWTTFVGAGREAFAHPTFARELLGTGRMDPARVCITCSSCSQLMRDGTETGCVPRDKDVYSPIFVAGRRKNPAARKAPHPVDRHV